MFLTISSIFLHVTMLSRVELVFALLRYAMSKFSTCLTMNYCWQSQIAYIYCQHIGRPHYGSVGPGLCATSSPRVILSVTMSYFGHNEYMHGFWSI
jgi:hypothetical protein